MVERRAVSSSAVSQVREFRSWVAGLDGADLLDAERIGLVAERVKGASTAAQARVTVGLADSQLGDAAGSGQVRQGREDGVARRRAVGSQVALARRESPSLGDRFVGVSRALVHELPFTMRALAGGVIGERHAVAMVRETACLTVEDRAEVDRRVGPVLGVKGVAGAARRVAAELDAASVVARMESAVTSRHVTVRPAPDAMAYPTVLGPLTDVVGAHAAPRTRAAAVVGGQAPDESADGRGTGAVAADTALRLRSGRAVGLTQPVEVQLVMTDRSLLGPGGASRSAWEPARVPGYGQVPAPVARGWVGAGENRARDEALEEAGLWLRRLYSSPDGRDLVAMDSRRRVFSGQLRRMLVLRDDVCSTPWCEPPIVHADHAHPARAGGDTSFGNGSGLCARCNEVKEAPGRSVRVAHTGLDPGGGHPREILVTTPTRHTYRATAPPSTGWGADDPLISPLEAHLGRLLVTS